MTPTPARVPHRPDSVARALEDLRRNRTLTNEWDNVIGDLKADLLRLCALDGLQRVLGDGFNNGDLIAAGLLQDQGLALDLAIESMHRNAFCVAAHRAQAILDALAGAAPVPAIPLCNPEMPDGWCEPFTPHLPDALADMKLPTIGLALAGLAAAHDAGAELRQLEAQYPEPDGGVLVPEHLADHHSDLLIAAGAVIDHCLIDWAIAVALDLAGPLRHRIPTAT